MARLLYEFVLLVDVTKVHGATRHGCCHGNQCTNDPYTTLGCSMVLDPALTMHKIAGPVHFTDSCFEVLMVYLALEKMAI